MKTESLKRTKAHVIYKNADGKRIPGATSITSQLDKPALVPWSNNLGLEGIDVRTYVDKLAEVGKIGHYLVECEFKNEKPDLSPFPPELIDKAENAVISFYAWEKDKEIKPLLVEAPMVSEEHQFGGTVDFFGDVDGKQTLVDLKTGKALYPEHIIQVAAYKKLLTENGFPVESVRILRIGRDETEGFEDRVLTVEHLAPAWELFKHLLAVYQLRKQL